MLCHHTQVVHWSNVVHVFDVALCLLVVCAGLISVNWNENYGGEQQRDARGSGEEHSKLLVHANKDHSILNYCRFYRME